MKIKKMVKDLHKVISILIVKPTDEDIKNAVKKLIKIAEKLNELDEDIENFFKNFNDMSEVELLDGSNKL
jgi:dimeric dUTPase (all-alpha-NTP-PPase superfamily)